MGQEVMSVAHETYYFLFYFFVCRIYGVCFLFFLMGTNLL